MNEITSRLLEVLKKHGLSDQAICRTLNANRNKVDDWRKSKSTPTLEDIKVLAASLSVSADYLLGLSNTPPYATPQGVVNNQHNKESSKMDNERLTLECVYILKKALQGGYSVYTERDNIKDENLRETVEFLNEKKYIFTIVGQQDDYGTGSQHYETTEEGEAALKRHLEQYELEDRLAILLRNFTSGEQQTQFVLEAEDLAVELKNKLDQKKNTIKSNPFEIKSVQPPRKETA